MSRGKDLLKNTGILIVAKISTQFVSFLLLPLYTALLSTTEYGEIDIYTSLVMIVVPFLTLQLEMGMFRFFITEKSNTNRCKIISTTFTISFFTVVVASDIYAVIATLCELKYAAYIGGYYISMIVSTVLLQVCRAYGNNKAYGFASFLGSALTVCLNVLFIAGLHWKVEGILLSSTIAQFVSAFYIIGRTKVFQYYNIKYVDKKVAKKLLKYSVPLIFNQVSSWAINYSDRIIILNAWGVSANGIYSLANKFSNITNTFFNVFNIAWTENVVRSMNDRDNIKYINRMFKLIYNIYLVIITGIVNLLPFFFSILVNSNYNNAYGHVPILLFAMFFSGMAATIGSVYIAYGKTKGVSVTTILAGVCNIVIHLLLLKSAGLYAASISTLISFGLLFVYRYQFVRKFFPLHIQFCYMVPQICIYVLSSVFYISGNSIMIVLGLLLNLMYIGYIILQNKELVLSLAKKK
ncbi:MAG: lipopolysaccharide biosynthesis protein [Lachnospirales bacterium]